jgi:hypothetical protein
MCSVYSYMTSGTSPHIGSITAAAVTNYDTGILGEVDRGK